MDIKISGITSQIMREALAQARDGRLHILSVMGDTLLSPREDLSPQAPRILLIKVPINKIGAVIGPGGKQIRELEAHGAKVEVGEDGTIKIYSEDTAAAKTVEAAIKDLTTEAEVGAIYEGRVVKTVDFGAFINLFPGTDGLLHISQIAEGRIDKVEDHLKEGDPIQVKVNTIDDRGKIDLVRPELEGIVTPRSSRPSRPNRPGRGSRESGNRGRR